MIGQVATTPIFNISMFYNIFTSLVELVADVAFFSHQHRQQHSSAQYTPGQGFPPNPSSRRQKGLGMITQTPVFIISIL